VGGGCEETQDKQLTLLYILDGREARHARRAARRRENGIGVLLENARLFLMAETDDFA
jgi:hypothetical protein